MHGPDLAPPRRTDLLAAALARIATASGTEVPWLLPYREPAQRIAAWLALHPGPDASLARALDALLATRPPIVLDAGRLSFEPASALASGESYELHIARTAGVPTRDDPHDLFNALVWLVHPALKARLHRLHAAELERFGGVGATRGALRDALSLFDENGAILHAPAALTDALRARDWQALFAGLRPLWREARLRLVGHALLEKLLQPRKAITAHVWLVESVDDEVLVDGMTPERLATKPFHPLPVLGVPGWWPDNEASEFYADPEVFRPARR